MHHVFDMILFHIESPLPVSLVFISVYQHFYQRKSASTLLSEVRAEEYRVGNCTKIPVGIIMVVSIGAVSGINFCMA